MPIFGQKGMSPVRSASRGCSVDDGSVNTNDDVLIDSQNAGMSSHFEADPARRKADRACRPASAPPHRWRPASRSPRDPALRRDPRRAIGDDGVQQGRWAALGRRFGTASACERRTVGWGHRRISRERPLGIRRSRLSGTRAVRRSRLLRPWRLRAWRLRPRRLRPWRLRPWWIRAGLYRRPRAVPRWLRRSPGPTGLVPATTPLLLASTNPTPTTPVASAPSASTPATGPIVTTPATLPTATPAIATPKPDTTSGSNNQCTATSGGTSQGGTSSGGTGSGGNTSGGNSNGGSSSGTSSGGMPTCSQTTTGGNTTPGGTTTGGTTTGGGTTPGGDTTPGNGSTPGGGGTPGGVTSTPEPASLAMLATAFGAVLLARARRRAHRG